MLLGFIPSIWVARTTLAGTRQIVSQMIAVDEILSLRPKDTRHLVGNPGRTIAYAVYLRVFIPADPQGATGELFSCLLRAPCGGAAYRTYGA